MLQSTSRYAPHPLYFTQRVGNQPSKIEALVKQAGDYLTWESSTFNSMTIGQYVKIADQKLEEFKQILYQLRELGHEDKVQALIKEYDALQQKLHEPFSFMAMMFEDSSIFKNF